jgi:hypothetical protein
MFNGFPITRPKKRFTLAPDIASLPFSVTLCREENEPAINEECGLMPVVYRVPGIRSFCHLLAGGKT